MAAPTGFIARSLSFLGITPSGQDPAPIRQASPEDASAPPPAQPTNMFTRAWDGFSIGEAWLNQLGVNDDSALQREGVQDLKLFDALLDDDVAASTFQQRRLALVSRPWVVEPGDPDDARSVLAADDLRDMLNAVGWDRVCDLVLYGRWYGYAVAEALYTVKNHKGRTIYWLNDLVVPDRKWFAFTNAGELRMRTPGGAEGVAVPPNKFWSWRTGATHDFAMYGTGLAHWCYWPIWFKRNVLQFWALYLEKFGQPTAVVPFAPGSSEGDVQKALAVGKAIGSDSAVAIPANGRDASSGYDLKPYLLEATRTGSADGYMLFIDKMDTALTRVILSQTMTSTASASGIGSNQADVHKDVRDEVVKADSDGLHESFNRTIPVWLTRWNHGDDVAPPTVYRRLDDDEDLTAVATRDATLDGIGWKRTEDSFRETYGDGYEKKPDLVPVVPRAAIGPDGKPLPANDNTNPAQVANFTANDDPAPLYVSRRLLNASDLIAWAKAKGFKTTEASGDMHVTVLYSKTPVDWFDMAGEGWDTDKVEVGEGGPRAVVQLGEDGAVVLRFASPMLTYRHDSMIERGASSDFPDYKPHVTFSYDGSGVDLATIEPYTGPLRFGPEIFERIKSAADSGPELVEFSADQIEAIDRMTAELASDTDPLFVAMGEAVADRVAAFTAGGNKLTAEGFRIALLQAAERFPIAELAKRLALPMAAERAGAAAGVSDLIEP